MPNQRAWVQAVRAVRAVRAVLWTALLGCTMTATAQAWTAPEVLRAVVAEAHPTAAPRLALAVAANHFVNTHLLFAPDAVVWGVADHWASPLESLNRGLGDCEDHAIAKYFILSALGWPDDGLRLLYALHDPSGTGQGGRPHLVLAVYTEAGPDPWVLDSLAPELSPASRRADLQPVFSFNQSSLWVGLSDERVHGSARERLRLWAEVAGKARREGFVAVGQTRMAGLP